MELGSSRRTNLHMCNNIEELRITKKFILEIAELIPNDHKSEKKINVTQSMKNRENVNSDLQEYNNKSSENGQIEGNHIINICRNYRIGLECNFGKNCRYRHNRKKEQMKDRVCWLFGKPQGC